MGAPRTDSLSVTMQVLRDFLVFACETVPGYSFFGAIIGGLAVAAHGYSRTTQDVDLAILIERCPQSLQNTHATILPHEAETMVVRKIADLVETNRFPDLARLRNNQPIHASAPSPFSTDPFPNGVLSIPLKGPFNRLDLIFCLHPWQKNAVRNAVLPDEWNYVFPVVRIEDLILMKLYGGSRKDLYDIEMLLEHCKQEEKEEIQRKIADLGWKRKWKEFRGGEKETDFGGGIGR